MDDESTLKVEVDKRKVENEVRSMYLKGLEGVCLVHTRTEYRKYKR